MKMSPRTEKILAALLAALAAAFAVLPEPWNSISALAAAFAGWLGLSRPSDRRLDKASEPAAPAMPEPAFDPDDVTEPLDVRGLALPAREPPRGAEVSGWVADEVASPPVLPAESADDPPRSGWDAVGGDEVG